MTMFLVRVGFCLTVLGWVILGIRFLGVEQIPLRVPGGFIVLGMFTAFLGFVIEAWRSE